MAAVDGICPLGLDIMPHVFPFFVTPRLEAFRFLQTRFGFDTPEIEQIGRECFIRYRKGDRWVSIACEPGSVPIEIISTPRLRSRIAAFLD